jgi:hypothetical protein
MRKLVLFFFALGMGGCDASSILLPVPIPIPIVPPSASLVPLDGQWVLADDAGGRSCLVIQESRVSILDVTCSSDGLGLASQIRESPVISRSGLTIVLSVVYNLRSGQETPSKLVFAGTLQVDSTFVGKRHDETIVPPKNDVLVVEHAAILSRL